MAINTDLVEVKPVSQMPVINVADLVNSYLIGHQKSSGDPKKLDGQSLLDYLTMLNIGFQGSIAPTDTEPSGGWATGFYIAAPGTYPNAGNLTVSPNTLGILTRVGTTWSKVEMAISGAVDEVSENGVVGVNSKAVINYAQPLDFFPYNGKPTTNDQLKVANAVLEFYPKYYDENYNYYLVLLRHNYNYGTGSLNGLKVVKRHKTNLSDVTEYEWESHTVEHGIQLVNIQELFYVIVDWSKVPESFQFANAVSDEFLLRKDINIKPFLISQLTVGKQQPLIVPKDSQSVDFTPKNEYYRADGTHYVNNNVESTILPTFDGYLFITGIDNHQKFAHYLDASKNVVAGTKIDILPNTPFAVNDTHPYIVVDLMAADDTFAEPQIFKNTTGNFKIEKINGIQISADVTIDPDLFATKDELSQKLSQSAADNRYAFKNTTAYSQSQSDSRYALAGNITNAEYKFIDAADFGVLPTNNGITNADNLQNALNGGNKTITFSKPGNYKFSKQVLLDDRTTLNFGNGVNINRDAYIPIVFLNRGALTRTWNEEIHINNLKISGGGFDAILPMESPIYGLNGLVSLFYVKNCSVSDMICDDIDHTNWPLQICTYENVTLRNIRHAGMKDGIHTGPGYGLKVYGSRAKTYDDSIAFNAFDYPESNPEIGDIKNVLIEGFIDEHDASWNSESLFSRILVGTVSDWYNGKPIVRGDAVINPNNGFTYRAIKENTPDSTTYTSQTEPTIDTFEGFQMDGAGFKWKLIKKSAIRTAWADDITYNKIAHHQNRTENTNGRILSLEIGALGFNRTIHPDVLEANYPKATNIRFNGLSSKWGGITFDPQVELKMFINGWSNPVNTFLFASNALREDKTFVQLENCDLSDTGDYCVQMNNGNLVVKDCIVPASGLFVHVPYGTVNSNVNVTGADLLALIQPKKGDELKINGVKKIYNGATWIDLN